MFIPENPFDRSPVMMLLADVKQRGKSRTAQLGVMVHGTQEGPDERRRKESGIHHSDPFGVNWIWRIGLESIEGQLG